MNRVFGTYTLILSRDSSWRFSVAGWFARLVRSTSGISTILLVVSYTHSYAIAGAVGAAIVLGIGVASTLWSRATDRFGQARVLPVAIVTLALASTLLVVVVVTGAPRATWFIAAFVLGAVSLDSGSLVRARWAGILTDAGERHNALALESVGDELSFVIGPPLVTVLATVVNPVLGFAVGVGITIAGQVALLAQRSTTPPVVRAAAEPFSLRTLLPRGVLPVLPIYLGVGVTFGALDVTSVAVGRSVGTPALAGLLVGAYSLGSVIAGIAFGPLSARWRASTRMLSTAIAFALVIPVLMLFTNAGVLAAFIVLGGLVTSPVLISGASFIQDQVESHRLTEALAWPAVGLSAGVVLGSAVSGILIDDGTAYSGFLITTAGGAIVGLAGVASALVLRSFRPL
ncbi:MAG: hypothetical protein JWR53_1002 [Glaciihabitans sp.]|nr:hypothetical protein [Glaciihabitans sp.]